ncbi:hypothetical protein FPHYL_14207, partial [Fusarium phyllophilum]
LVLPPLTGSDALSGGDQISGTKTESHEEALQAFGDQPQAQPDGVLTLYGVPFQGTRKALHQNRPPGGPHRALDALFTGAPGGSGHNPTPGTQGVPFTGALGDMREKPRRVLDALFTGGAGKIVDWSVEDGGFTGVPEGSEYDQMRGDQDIPCIVPPAVVSDMPGSSERDIRRIRRETAVLPRGDR